MGGAGVSAGVAGGGGAAAGCGMTVTAGGGGVGVGGAPGSGQGLVLVAVLLCSTLRGSRLQESRVGGGQLLSVFLTFPFWPPPSGRFCHVGGLPTSDAICVHCATACPLPKRHSRLFAPSSIFNQNMVIPCPLLALPSLPPCVCWLPPRLSATTTTCGCSAWCRTC